MYPLIASMEELAHMMMMSLHHASAPNTGRAMCVKTVPFPAVASVSLT